MNFKYASEVRLPIESGSVAKPEKSSILSVCRDLSEPSFLAVMLIQGSHAFEAL